MINNKEIEADPYSFALTTAHYALAPRAKSRAELHAHLKKRGVEDETLACGTGITAAAIAYAKTINSPSSTINIKAKGGNLQVSFSFTEEKYKNIWLNGPAQKVFEGTIEL